MQKPHFVRLARIDAQHLVTACRHGLVHLTWGRMTLRFGRDEFRKLAGLLSQVIHDDPPSTMRDGHICVVCRQQEECEIRIESLVLLLPPQDFDEFVGMMDEARDRLESLDVSGFWDERAEQDPSSAKSVPEIFPHLRRTPFSDN